MISSKEEQFLNKLAELGIKLSKSWKKTQKTQKVLIVIVAVLTIAALVAVVSMANRVDYAILYTNLSEKDAGEVYSKLKDDMEVDVQAKANGTIMVPKDQVNQLRYMLNAQGFPASDISYDLYAEKAGAFSATDKDKAVYERYQLQANISQTINKMDKIKASTVIITPAEKSQFVLSDSNRDATASVMLEVEAGQTLSAEDANSIRSLVSQAVPSLPQENITIVDSKMNIYNEADLGSGASAVGTQLDLQNSVARQLEQQMLKLLTPVFGAEKLSASVNVALDFDKSTKETLTLSPPGDEDNMGIITSMKTMEERILNGTGAQGEPGLDTNGGAPVYQVDQTTNGDNTYTKITEEINAEVNEVKELIENAQGDIKDISATLIIDGGQELADMLPQIRTQIATAVGIPEDKITVSSMPFAENTMMQQMMEEQTLQAETQERNEMIKSIVTIAAILGGILIVLMLILSTVKKGKEMMLEAERQRALEEQERINRINLAADDEISVADLLDGKKDATLEQVQSMINTNAETIAQVLRNWLLDDGRR